MNIETVAAFFVIALVSFYILANFTAGFILPLWLLTMGLSVALVLAYPRSGIYAIVPLTFVFERFFTLSSIVMGRNEYKLYPLDMLLVAIFAATVFGALAGRQKYDLKKPDWLLLAFVAIACAYFVLSMTIFGADKSLAFSSLKYYAFYPIVYFATMILLKTEQQLARLMNFALAGAVTIIGFVAYGALAGQGLWTEFTPLTTEGSRILAASHAFPSALAFLGALSYLICKKQGRSLPHNLLLALWGVGIVGSLMKNIWLGLFVGAAVAVYISRRTHFAAIKRLFSVNAALAGLALLTLVYVFVISPYSGVSQKMADVSGALSARVSSATMEDDSVYWRYAVWTNSFKEYFRSPLIGMGLGQKIFVEIEKRDYRNYVELRDIHNSFFVMLFQLGPLAFLIFLYLVYTVFKKLLHKTGKRWYDVFFLSAIAMFVVVAQFQPYLEVNMSSIFFWMLLALARNSYSGELLKADRSIKSYGKAA